MNKIYVDIDFTNGILEKKGIDLITGDYASTEIEFTFDESHSTGRKVFEMKSPSNELVIVKEIEDNKVLLASKDENQNNVSLFDESGYYIFEVSYYDNDSKLTSVYGKIPVEQEQVVIDGEVVTPYLPIFDQLIQDLNNKIDEVDTKLEEVDTKLDNIDTALENVNAAIEETNNLDINVSDKSNKEVTITLTKKDNTTKSVKINDGVSLQFMWQGTSLGIKTDDMQEYVFVNLQGIQGVPGPQGEPFRIKKTYPSVQAMQDDFNNMQYGDYVMIASSVEVQDNAKLYTRGEQEWIFITDFSGATGIRGPVGATPNIQIGNVTSGSTPSVTRTGTDENPILNFVLEKGEKGDKPVKGVDYFTTQDKQEIVSEVTEDATSTFNQNVIAKTNEFNANAIQKTTEFNTNAQEKTDEFNANKEKLQQELERYKLIENALPHVTGSGESVALNNTANAGMTVDLEPNTSQESTPSPDYPQQVHVVSGDNTLKVGNKNLFDRDNTSWYRNNNSLFVYNADESTTRLRTTSFAIKGGKTYTLSGLPSGITFGGVRTYTDNTPTGTNTADYTKTDNTFTLGENVKYINLWFSGENFTDATKTLMANANIMLNEGTTVLPYEPHEEQIAQLNLGDLEYCEIPNSDYKDQFYMPSGKQLLNIPDISITNNGLTLTFTNGIGKITGTWVSATNLVIDNLNITLSANTYTLSTNSNVAGYPYLTLYNENTQIVTMTSSDNNVKTFTINEETTITKINIYCGANRDYKEIRPMLNLGTTALPYEPYNDGKWYLKKNTRHLSLKIADMNNAENYPGWKYQNQLFNDFSEYNGPLKNLTKYSCNIVLEKDNYFYLNTRVTDNILFIAREVINLTQTEWKTNYPDLEVELYYGLQTPEYILLNDTLQEQLNTIYNMLLSYKGQTNITQENNDLPFEIVASALKDISNL